MSISKASLSFVPTPSVPETRYESPKVKSPEKPPILDEGPTIALMRSTRALPASMSTPASWKGKVGVGEGGKGEGGRERVRVRDGNGIYPE